MTKTRVGVIRGGVGHEYEVSLATGAGVLKCLDQNKYEPIDILITKDKVWHYRGLPIKLSDLPNVIDVGFNALHGEFGEDGRVQRLLEEINLPYTGSKSQASAIGLDKYEVKEILQAKGILVPRGILLEKGDKPVLGAREVFQKIAPPWIVKPKDRGSSVGIYLAKTFLDLEQAIASSLRFSDYVLVEEYIKGRESSCGVINNFRGNDVYTLPPIEIFTPPNNFWSYEDKYSGLTRKTCPGCFKTEEKYSIQELAKTIHQLLGLRHYSRSDFRVTPRGVYVLEANTLPGLMGGSPLTDSMEAVGVTHADFLDHIITMSLLGD